MKSLRGTDGDQVKNAIGFRDNQTYKFLVLATVFDPNVWLATLINDLEWKVLHIGLHFYIGEFTTNETLGIENTGRIISASVERASAEEN